MKINLDRVSGLCFLALSVGYYVLATDIELYPGDDEELINAQTFPKVIASVAMLISFLITVLPAGGNPTRVEWRRMDWVRPVVLCALMVAYGLTVKWPGFFLATSGFLAGGFLLLGERRWWIIVPLALVAAGGFEAILHGLLDIYIEDPFLAFLGVRS